MMKTKTYLHIVQHCLISTQQTDISNSDTVGFSDRIITPSTPKLTVEYRDGSITLGGYFSAVGTGVLHKTVGNLRREQCVEIFK